MAFAAQIYHAAGLCRCRPGGTSCFQFQHVAARSSCLTFLCSCFLESHLDYFWNHRGVPSPILPSSDSLFQARAPGCPSNTERGDRGDPADSPASRKILSWRACRMRRCFCRSLRLMSQPVCTNCAPYSTRYPWPPADFGSPCVKLCGSIESDTTTKSASKRRWRCPFGCRAYACTAHCWLECCNHSGMGRACTSFWSGYTYSTSATATPCSSSTDAANWYSYTCWVSPRSSGSFGSARCLRPVTSLWPNSRDSFHLCHRRGVVAGSAARCAWAWHRTFLGLRPRPCRHVRRRCGIVVLRLDRLAKFQYEDPAWPPCPFYFTQSVYKK